MNSSVLPIISIVIPCRNEERFIGRCIESILAQDYPKDKLEIIIADGMSTDRTRDIIKGYISKHGFIKLLDNPRRITPVAMNIGISGSIGDRVLMLNSHAVIDRLFLMKIAESAEVTGADGIGGALNTINEGEELTTQAIPLAADSIFGAGGKRYRSRKTAGFVNDTLPYTAYKKEVFDKIGLIDEDLIRDQDEEFNYRLLNSGGRIYFSPEIKSFLNLRPSLKKLWRQHFQYGYFKPLVVMKSGASLTWRQLIPALFVSSLALTGLLALFTNAGQLLLCAVTASYAFASLFSAALVSIKHGIKFLPVLPVVFATLHISYGLGYLKGIWDFAVLKNNKRKKIKDMPLTR